MSRQIEFTFQPVKAVEAALYVAQNLPNPTIYSVSKLLYSADKLSLEHYGYFISGDHYIALNWGAVPANTYTLMTTPQASLDAGFQVEPSGAIVTLREPNLAELTEEDGWCLVTAIENYANLTFWQRSSESHDAAWTKAWSNRGTESHSPISIEMILSLFKDGDAILEHLQGLQQSNE